MRTFAQGRTARAMAHVLTVAFVWSAVFVGVALRPAEAQIPSGYASSSAPVVSARTATGQSVAVVPFGNLSGYRPDTFGEEASEAVAADLRDRLFLDVMPRADVELWMRDLGYAAPLSDAEMVRLATELEVALVVTGEVRKAQIMQGREGRYGQVVLAIRLFDRVAQTAVNGALVDTRGPSSLEASNDALLMKALQQATFDAIQQMKTRPTVTAMVLWAGTDVVRLNVGSRAGVSHGMKMAAIRSGQRIGLVEVTEAQTVGSYAKLVEGPPLRTGDRLRAIYELPTGIAAPSPARIQRKQARWTTFVLAAAALLGVADLGSTARTLGEGNVAAPAFMATNLANGAELGYSTVVFIPGFMYVTPSVLITWVPYSGTEKTRIVSYEIIRDGEIVTILSPEELVQQNFVIDFAVGIVIEEVTFTVDPTTGFVAFSRTFDEYNPDSPPTDLGTVASEYDLTIRWLTYSPTAGMPYVYRVKPIIKTQVRLLDGTYEWQFDLDTEYSSTRNYITAVAPSLPAGVDVSGTVGTFFFYSPIGADEAIIQVAKDPYNDFPPDKIYQKVIPGLWTGRAELALENVQVDFADLAGLPGDATILWWRIGARNRQDSAYARPWPLERLNDYGWVWSLRQRLLVFSGASRASLLHRQREVLGATPLDRNRDLRRPGVLRGDRVLRAQ